LGFVLATGALHLAGIGLGFAVEKPAGRNFVRGCGGLIAVVGCGYLFGVL
jgi:urease accessory protein